MAAVKTKERKNVKPNGYSYHAEYLIEGTQCSFVIGYVMLKGEAKIPITFADGLMAQGETGGEFPITVIRMDKERYQFSIPQTYVSDLTAYKESLELAEMLKREIESAVNKLLTNERF